MANMKTMKQIKTSSRLKAQIYMFHLEIQDLNNCLCVSRKS